MPKAWARPYLAVQRGSPMQALMRAAVSQFLAHAPCKSALPDAKAMQQLVQGDHCMIRFVPLCCVGQSKVPYRALACAVTVGS